MQSLIPNQAEDAYYAGLFCDVGKLAFDLLMQKGIIQQKGFRLDASNPHNFQETESSMFGYDHPLVSAAMARRWKLPDFLVQVIQFHHLPGKMPEPYRTMAYAVHAADAAMMMMGIGLGVDGLQYPLDPETVKVLHWTDDSFEKLVNRVLPMISEAETFLKQ